MWGASNCWYWSGWYNDTSLWIGICTIHTCMKQPHDAHLILPTSELCGLAIITFVMDIHFAVFFTTGTHERGVSIVILDTHIHILMVQQFANNIQMSMVHRKGKRGITPFVCKLTSKSLHLSNSHTMSKWSLWLANVKSHRCRVVACNKAHTISKWPSQLAHINGVSPYVFGILTLTLVCFNNSQTQSKMSMVTHQ